MSFRQIRNRFRLIPFGKFALSGRGKAPFNQTFVGRSKERAAFIELITHQEKFGAFMISGRRGSGKTSFVEYVLSEYNHSAFQRFIRFGRGRGIKDFIVGLALSVIVAAIIVLLSQAIILLTQNVYLSIHSQKASSLSLNWTGFVLAGLLLLTSVIWTLAWRGIHAVTRMKAKGGARAIILTLSCLYIILFIYHLVFGNVFSKIRFLVCDISEMQWLWVYFLVPLASLFFYFLARSGPKLYQATLEFFKKFSVSKLQKLANYTISFSAIIFLAKLFTDIGLLNVFLTSINDALASFRGITGGIQICLIMIISIAASNTIIRNLSIMRNSEGKIERRWIFKYVKQILVINFFIVLTISIQKFGADKNYPKWIYTAALVILCLLHHLMDFTANRSKSYFDGQTNKLEHERTHFVLFFLLPIFTAFGFISTLIACFLNPPSFVNYYLILMLTPTFIISCIPIRRFLRYKLFKKTDNIKSYHDRPPVEFILIIKSSFLFLLAFALLAPVLNMFGLLPPELYSPTTQYNFPDVRMDEHTIFAIMATLVVIFFYEYEWIGKSLRTERQDASIAPLGRSQKHAQLNSLWPKLNEKIRDDREDSPEWYDFEDGNPLRYSRNGIVPPWMRKQEIARTLEKATFSYIYYETRVPVLTTWINLGFDDLRHSQIIEAMLVQLRSQYRAKFIGFNSKIGLFTAVLATILLLFLSKHFANTFFHINKINLKTSEIVKLNGQEQTATSSNNVLPANYCKFFNQFPSYAPAANNAICLLPYSNQLYAFLYSPLLSLSVDFYALAVLKEGSLVLDTSFHGLEINDNADPNGEEKYNSDEKAVKKKADSNKERFGLEDLYCANNSSGMKSAVCFPKKHDSLILKFLLDSNYGLPFVKKETLGYFAIQRNWYHPDVVKQNNYTEKHIAESGLPTIRVYHLLVFLIVYLILRIGNDLLAVFPYKARENQITRLLALIRGRVTYTVNDMPKVGWLQWLFGIRRRDETIETKPDSRVVEQSFIDLLQSITTTKYEDNRYFWTWFENKPEVVFVFDEMDKLSGKVDAEVSRNDEASNTIEENSRERQRSMQLHQLLSDMKRLLSSNSARFIFIGGRLYHDEWLADQAISTPLLSSIFSGQIYLPSLLTDREHSFGRFNDRIAEFLILMFRNSKHRYEYWRRLRHSPAFIGSSNMMDPTYIQASLPHSGHPRRMAAMAHYVQMRVLDETGKPYNFHVGEIQHPLEHEGFEDVLLTTGEQETLEQLLNFLTYRSAGNPKKLKEILQTLVLPSSKAFSLPRYNRSEQHDVRWGKYGNHHDSLVLDDSTIYRIQFIDVLYRHLAEHLEGRMLNRDDKVAMSVFYLMDFLLKFHNRAFSWTNLQHVDELSHIHRAPDLKSMMGVLVDVSSERFLHRVFNGVYSFRFRSDFSREIDYLSRISKEEMAAFNFTLDESQNLKGLYQQTLLTGDRENIDTISGLGELYEYDQEYEIARNYYRRAVALLDNMYRESTGAKFSPNTQLTARGELSNFDKHNKFILNLPQSGEVEWLPLGMVQQNGNDPDAKAIIKSNFTWAIARLRLMLQIGHTYEQENNYERALSSYMHANKFSRAILKATQNSEKADGEYDYDGDRSISVENYSILYQSSLAAAWIFEKNNQDIDDSIVHAEQFVGWIYKNNPNLLSGEWAELSKDNAHSEQNKTSVMLLAGDLHDSIGDIYFYKGKQSLRGVRGKIIEKSKKKKKLRFGYLLQAHYHYAFSIWNIRNYLELRTRMSGNKLNILADSYKTKDKKTLHKDGLYPDLLHNSLANALTDMSEAILARTSIGQLLKIFYYKLELDPSYDSADKFEAEYSKYKETLGDSIWHFNQLLPQTGASRENRKDQLQLTSLYSTKDKKKCHLFGEQINAGNTSVWLGRVKDWPKNFVEYETKRTLIFKDLVSEEKRLNAYFFFSTAAAKNYAVAGYSIDAANEYFLQAETAICTLWAIKQGKWLSSHLPNQYYQYVDSIIFNGASDKISKNPEAFSQAQSQLGTIAMLALKKATNLIQGSYRPSATRTGQNHGDPAKIKAGIAAELERQENSTPIDFVTLITKAYKTNAPFLHELKQLRLSEVFDLIKGANNFDQLKNKIQKKYHPTSGSDDYLIKQLSKKGIKDTQITKDIDLTFDNLHKNIQPNVKLIDDLNAEIKELDKNSDLADDYNMSQSWRDEPRIYTLGAQLVLALTGEGKGPEILANLVYEKYLNKHSQELFPKIDDDAVGEVCSEKLIKNTFNGYYKSCERFRYPILNRLKSISFLCEAAIIHDKAVLERDADESHNPANTHSVLIGSLCNELIVTADIYSAERHFSPHLIGSALTFAFFYCIDQNHWTLYDNSTGKSATDIKVSKFNAAKNMWHRKKIPNLTANLITRESLGENALNQLRRAEQMFSMGKAYYENINEMQFLNDEFNDRNVHYNHARRMFASELIHAMASSVHDELKSYGQN